MGKKEDEEWPSPKLPCKNNVRRGWHLNCKRNKLTS